LGVTIMAAVEPADSYVDRLFSPQGIAFLTDAIIIQRYGEIDGAVGRTLKGYQGLLTGTPSLDGKRRRK